MLTGRSCGMQARCPGPRAGYGPRPASRTRRAFGTASFCRTARAQQREKLTRPDVEREVVDRAEIAELLADPFDAQQRHAGGRRLGFTPSARGRRRSASCFRSLFGVSISGDFPGHVICQPLRGRKLAADRHPLYRFSQVPPQYCRCQRAVSAKLCGSPSRLEEEKMNRDRYDLPLTTASDRAAALYRDGVDRMLSAWHGAAEAFDQAIAEDPAFALAHIARARVHQLNMEGAQGARPGRAGAGACRSATPREKPHVEIMAAVIEGKPKFALAAPRRISKNIRATRWCCRCCSARSASTRSPAVPTTMRPARDLRAPCPSLWRGLVVPQLSGLVAHRGG